MTQGKDFDTFRKRIMKLNEKQLLQFLLIEKYTEDVTDFGKLGHKKMIKITELVEKFFKDELTK